MKYLIASANGYGNVGDDLIAISIGDQLKAIDANAAVRLTRPPLDEALVKRADVVIVGGGGILYDYDKLKLNTKNYTSYLKVAKENNIPAYVVGVGEQGIFSDKAKQVYRQALSSAHLITTRSQADRDVLVNDVGVAAPVLATQDPVFSLDYAKHRAARPKVYPFRIPGLGKPRLAFNLPKLTNQGLDLNALGMTTAQNLEAYNNYLEGESITQLFKDFKVTLVCQSRDDADYYRMLSDRFGCSMVYPSKLPEATTVIEVYKQADLILTGRFHGLALAAMLGKPVVSVGITGQKLDKLISERLSSLAGSFYPVEKFIKRDVASILKQLYKQGKVAQADPKQVEVCQRLANLNRYLLEVALLNDFGPRLLS